MHAHDKKTSVIEVNEKRQLQNKPTKYPGPIQAINYNYFEYFSMQTWWLVTYPKSFPHARDIYFPRIAVLCKSPWCCIPQKSASRALWIHHGLLRGYLGSHSFTFDRDVCAFICTDFTVQYRHLQQCNTQKITKRWKEDHNAARK